MSVDNQLIEPTEDVKIKNQDMVIDFLSSGENISRLLYVENYDSFFEYQDGGYYKLIGQFQFKQRCMEYWARRYPFKNLTGPYIKDLLTLCALSAPRTVESLNAPYIAMTDGLYSLEDFSLHPFDHLEPVLTHLPYPSTELQQETPVFDKFLATTFVKEFDKKETDQEMIDFIQEVFGYYLIPGLRGATAFFFVGTGANGKSVFIDLIMELVGPEATCSMGIEYLTTNNFATANLIGKTLNACNEEESKYLRSDKFKAIITGEMITAERKFGDAFHFRPLTKFVFASNDMPTFEGLNFGLKRRLKIIPFFRQFDHHEQDQELSKKLKTELAGIAGWALEGAQRFVERGYRFQWPAAVLAAEREFEESVSSAIWFSREYFEVSNDKEVYVSNTDLYNEYVAWCKTVGKKPTNTRHFGRDLKFAQIGSEQYFRRIDKINCRVWNLKRKTDVEIPSLKSLQNEIDLAQVSFNRHDTD